jgi:uncharacterized membrane protein YtjA (UPF0391 family)
MTRGWGSEGETTARTTQNYGVDLMVRSGKTIILVTEECAKACLRPGGQMLYWAAMFFVVALVAALLGFFGVATAAAGIAKILFYIFLVIFLVTLIMGLGRRGTRV